jgi:hypothetical protein
MTLRLTPLGPAGGFCKDFAQGGKPIARAAAAAVRKAAELAKAGGRASRGCRQPVRQLRANKRH